MCSNQVTPGNFYATRNDSIVAVQAKGDGTARMTATVIKSTSRQFPIGSQVTIQNEMGHVLCKGNDSNHQAECDLHPLDAVDSVFESDGFTAAEALKYTWGSNIRALVETEVREALRRRRYNLNRKARNRDLIA